MLFPRRPRTAEARPPSLAALRRELEALPQAPIPRLHIRNWTFRLKRMADFLGHSRPGLSRTFRRINPYPPPFRHVTFRTEDGVSIAAWLGPQHPEHPSDWGLVLVPGMFSTKDDSVHKRRAIWIWRHWRIPVIAIDLRAFGESTGIATAGWKEALDVHAAARELQRATNVERVAVLAESMGGAAALNALAHDSASEPRLLTAGMLVFSAFVDARDAVQYISARPPEDHPFRVAWGSFRRLLSIKSMGGYARFDDYLADAARVNGLPDLDALLDAANPKWKVKRMQAPLLLVHAADDPVVPVRHARRMERYARDQEHIQALVVPWGGHTGFETMDREWYWEVLRRFFAHVNGVDLPNPRWRGGEGGGERAVEGSVREAGGPRAGPAATGGAEN